MKGIKKILYLLMIIFLLVGCSKTVDTAATSENETNPKGYMNEPQILLSSEHRYKDESWVSEDIESKDGSVMLQGDSFFVTIIFQGSIPEDKFKEAVKMEGFTGESDIMITPSKVKTVFYGSYRNIDKNKPYKLTISKKIIDIEGRTLKDNVQKQITLKPDTTAVYSFISSEGSFYGLGWQNIVDVYAVDNMNLSPDPKTFIVDFSATVDKISVEQSIMQNLNNKNVECAFEWNNSKQLRIKLDNLKSGDPEPYIISMAAARDSEGNPIYGNLYFVTSNHNYLGSIDIKAKKNSDVYKFPDRRYMTIQNPKISNNIILDDTVEKYAFNMATKTSSGVAIDKECLKGIPGFGFKHSWLNSNTILMVKRSNGTVVSYSTSDGSSKELFTLPLETAANNIIDISASPDGSKLAVAYQKITPGTEWPDKKGFFIFVYDMKGKLIYQGEDVYRARFMEIFGAITDIEWHNEEAIVLEDNTTKGEQLDYNVISININTGKKTIIAEHAVNPVTLPSKNLLKVESFKDFGGSRRSIDIIKNDKVVRSFDMTINQYKNFFFSDESTLVYNEGEKIFAYHIDKSESEQLGNGYIIGLSEDGSKIYYLTNHKMLYYID